MAQSQVIKAFRSSNMDNSINNEFHELVLEQNDFVSDQWETEWEDFEQNWSPYDDSEGDEEPEEDDDFYNDGDSDSDIDSWHEADGYYSDDDGCMQDNIEYVHFGKGMEFNGEQWIWENDDDLSSEMSR
ncbi:hypothetical protein PEBR_03705 [Penicillium brasilianum]|uniref:Uncharacterized protein n=1 Tax=Penicillium brasilianum TaxID=104259 RepID=A0A1S9RYI5_PENBI|nr:hypothetical protein PEBR_03705 [Penicillium brasilianum]